MSGNGMTKHNPHIPTLKRQAAFDWEDIHQRIAAASAALERSDETVAEVMAQVWARRAERLARVSTESDKDEQVQLVMLRLGREVYGVDVQYVFDIRLLEALTHVPRVPDWMAGVVNLRGRIFSVVDLARFLGLAHQEATMSKGHALSEDQPVRYLVVVETPDMELAFLADEVLPMEEISLGQIQEVTTTVGGIRPDYVRGVAGRKSGNSLVVLDLPALLADKQLIVHEEIS
jgi:purine-binding chemotaxis protein CheW